MSDQELIVLAKKARENSYSPYSGFKVGAALLCKSGNVYLGANAENASYSLTVCAERAALFAALSNGEREFEAIAVLGGKDAEISDFCPPCGACRQALAEFSRDGSLKVITTDGNDVRALPLAKLLPESFSL